MEAKKVAVINSSHNIDWQYACLRSDWWYYTRPVFISLSLSSFRSALKLINVVVYVLLLSVLLVLYYSYNSCDSFLVNLYLGIFSSSFIWFSSPNSYYFHSPHIDPDAYRIVRGHTMRIFVSFFPIRFFFFGMVCHPYFHFIYFFMLMRLIGVYLPLTPLAASARAISQHFHSQLSLLHFNLTLLCNVWAIRMSVINNPKTNKKRTKQNNRHTHISAHITWLMPL